MSSFETKPTATPEQEVDTSYVDLVEGNLGESVGESKREAEAVPTDDMEALADELFGVTEKAPQSPEVVAELAERAEKIKGAYKGEEAQVMSEVIDGITPEEIIPLSKEEATAIQEAVNAGEIAIEYVSDLPKEWSTPKSLSTTNLEGFKKAFAERGHVNRKNQKKIAGAGLLGATASAVGGIGAIAAGGAGSAMALAGGAAIIFGGGGFMVLGGLGYVAKRAYDNYQEKKAVKGFTKAYTTATKSPHNPDLISDYISKLR